MLVGNLFGPDLGIIVIIVLVVLVGGSQLPKIARNVGSAGREFRKGQEEGEAEEAQKAAAKAAAAPPAPAPLAAAPVPVAPVAQTQAAAAAPAEDKVTLSRAELDALLDEKIKRSQSTN